MTDDETQGIVLSAATLAVPEAGSAAYEVKLASEPVGSSVTVTLAGAGSGLTADTPTQSGSQNPSSSRRRTATPTRL